MNRRIFLLVGGICCLLALSLGVWLAARQTTPQQSAETPAQDKTALLEPQAEPQPKPQPGAQGAQAPQPEEFPLDAAPEPPLPEPEYRPSTQQDTHSAWQSPPLPQLPPDPEPPAPPEPDQPPSLASPGEAMLDAARFFVSRYEHHKKKGRLRLQLYDLVDRYAPADLPQGVVYSVSPTAMRLVFLFGEKRFAELLRQQAEAELSPKAAAHFLQLAGEWLQGAAGCPAALEEQRPILAAPLEITDCKRSLERMRAMLDPSNRHELETTAGTLMERLAATVANQADNVDTDALAAGANE